MAGRIEIYLDVVSFYSYIAFKQLLETRPILEAHGVEVEYKPFLLGAINAGSGNKPPWTLPAKAKYGTFDFERSKNAVGLPEVSPPEDLMAVSRTILPLRALHYIKANCPLQTYLTVWHYLFHIFWGPVKKNITDAAELAKALGEVPRDFRGDLETAHGSSSFPPLFAKDDVERIMKATGEDKWKNELKAAVEQALERGAFGGPWLWVTNAKGESEPFFGSDRWHFVYEFLGLPYQKVALSAPDDKAKL